MLPLPESSPASAARLRTRTAFPRPHKHTRGTSSHAHLWDRALGGGSGAGAPSEAPLSTLHTKGWYISRSFVHTYTPPLDTCRRLRGGPALFQTFDWGGVFLRGFFVPAYIRFQRLDFQHRSVCLRTYVSHTLPPLSRICTRTPGRASLSTARVSFGRRPCLRAVFVSAARAVLNYEPLVAARCRRLESGGPLRVLGCAVPRLPRTPPSLPEPRAPVPGAQVATSGSTFTFSSRSAHVCSTFFTPMACCSRVCVSVSPGRVVYGQILSVVRVSHFLTSFMRSCVICVRYHANCSRTHSFCPLRLF